MLVLDVPKTLSDRSNESFFPGDKVGKNAGPAFKLCIFPNKSNYNH